MFWRAGCSLLWSEGFSCSLDGRNGKLGIIKLQFLIKKIKNTSMCLCGVRTLDTSRCSTGLRRFLLWSFLAKSWIWIGIQARMLDPDPYKRIRIRNIAFDAIRYTETTPTATVCSSVQWINLVLFVTWHYFIYFLSYGKFTVENTWFLAGRACLSHPRRMTFIGRKPTVPAAAAPAPAPSSRWVWRPECGSDPPHFYADPVFRLLTLMRISVRRLNFSWFGDGQPW